MASLRKIFFVVFLIACILYARAIGGAVMFGSHSWGLIMLAAKPTSEHTLNPFSENVSFISPERAEWILTSFDWPYRDTGMWEAADSEPQPNLHAAISFRTLFSREPEVTERMLRLAQFFIDRGDAVDARFMGLTSLHEAVFMSDPEAAQFLLERGADPWAVIDKPESKLNGMTAMEFAETRWGKNPQSQVGKSFVAVFAEATQPGK